MLGDLWLALGELRHRAFWGVAAASAALTLGLLGGLVVLVGWLLGVGEGFAVTLPWWGPVEAPGILGAVLYALAALGVSALLGGPVAALFVGLFLETVVAAVEQRAYPAAGPGQPAPWPQQVRAALSLMLAVLAGNLLVLLIALAVPPAAPLLLVAVNGWLLGREYVETVALRRMPLDAARAFRRTHRLRAFGVGAAMAAAMAVPVANLLAPLIGAAAATHLFHRAGAQARSMRPE